MELGKEALHKKKKKNANRGRLNGKSIMGREELKGGLSKHQNVQFGPDPSVHMFMVTLGAVADMSTQQTQGHLSEPESYMVRRGAHS